MPPGQRFMFTHPVFEFQTRYRLGLAATGAADLGEILAILREVDEEDDETWFEAWGAMARQVDEVGRQFLIDGHEVSAGEAFLRASNYYRAAEVFLSVDDHRRLETWRRGARAFDQMAALSGGLIERVDIPFEGTTLPGCWCRPDKSGGPHPLLLVQSGLDGTIEDLFATFVPAALARGYSCLAFEGPGQGAVIRVQGTPFRHDWEAIVTPVIDFALERTGADPDRVALLGYSMGGYLAPRAAAHEHRLRACVANSGVFSVFDGVASTFPSELGQLLERHATVDDNSLAAEIDDLVAGRMALSRSTAHFIAQMLWTFQVGSPSRLFRELRRYTMEDCIDRIQCEMLVVGSTGDTVAGSYEQSKLFFEALTCPKTYLQLDATQGAEKHCQAGAPMVANEHILNWLDERLQSRVAAKAR